MEAVYYRKGTDSAQDEDFIGARTFGKIRLGKQYLYGKKLLRWQQVRLSDVAQLWQHIQQVQSHTSCCEADFNIHRLHLLLKNGEQLVLMIGDELFRHEDVALLEAVAEQNPEILIRTPELQKTK